MIRNQPLMLTKWTPNLSVSKDNVAKVPVWVKIHKVHMVAYSEDGLKISAKTDLKKEVIMTIPIIDGEGYTKEKIKVEYEWRRPFCNDCHVFRHAFEQCPKRIKEMPKPTEEVHDDGFKTVVKRKSKGTAANSQKRYFRGVKIPNPKNLKYQPVEDYISVATVGETSDGNGGFDVFGEPNLESVLNKVDLDSEIKEMFIVEESHGSKPKGASTPFNDVPDVCSKVFKYWEWTSNAHVCTKGCRIILGWHMDVVNVVVLSQTDQMRLLWAELRLYKLVVRGMSWTLLGDFNVALNLEDTCFGSSSLSTDMVEFKDCVAYIEVMDINCSGLHCTWNQKPKSGGGILKKLGRIMGNVEFLDTFPGAHAYFQPYRISDHSPSVLTLVHDHGNLHDRVNKLRLDLDEVQKALDLCPTDQNLREAIYFQVFNEAKIDEERFLKQKAKVDWLEAGDSNSAYFHKSIKSRNQRSRIETIRTSNNVQMSGPGVLEAFVNHYKLFLGTDMMCDELSCDGLFNHLVSDQSRANMIRDVSDVEIKAAMFSIGDDRVSSPDGYTSAFFKKGWDVVGHDISLSNLLGGCAWCAFKIDIQKAYDTVDWRFLGEILTWFGFHPLMTKWIMACGDPFSPYLFTLVREVLTLILKRRVRGSDSFRYHQHCEELQLINVRFADDLFIFARGNIKSAQVIIESLEEFRHVSGLASSLPKSTAFFCNVVSHIKLGILNIMPFAEGTLPVIYIGVPLISSRLFNNDCKFLVVKAHNRIGDWKNKSLSFAERLQLCRLVISSMHVYWASVLMIPTCILLDIEQLIRGFQWCNGDLKRGKSKVAWNDICLPKSEGGLGIRSLEIFNIALGRSFWDVPLKCDVSWGWLKLLQLRDFVRPYFFTHIGNGKDISDWFDRWLQSWLLKAPTLGLIPTPSIDDNKVDVHLWHDSNGVMSKFSVKADMEAFRPRGMGVGVHIAHKRSAVSVIKILLLAASSYYIWIEQNNRLFKQLKRYSEELHDIIMVTVRLKLLTFRFKNTTKVNEFLLEHA
ncbi:hypothetical protein Tco_0993315 [Tanacetum coccineum]|uniref:Reverse transcriptase domain-containing protein n=1 Tax=Tanacetum coccineum TaxID=301880 RepID=A0ABQ5F4K3_9ASTR